MKIEMGESLGSSWMSHIKNCQFVQTNWKVSPLWKEKHSEQELLPLLGDIKNEFTKKGLDIFKQNANFQQIMRQTECDVLGCSFEDTTKFYALEVAYHGAQLNYGSRNVTISKVVAKLMRSALAFFCFFDVADAEVAFASPKIGNSMLPELNSAINLLQDIFNKHRFHFIFKLYANESFKNEILIPVTRIKNEVNDTAELFLRSIQLLDLFTDEDDVRETSFVRNTSRDAGDSSSVSQTAEPRIGSLIKTELIPILQREDFPQEEIDDLLTREYSKDTFKLNYPLLSQERNPAERYYCNPIVLHNKEYYICNDWYERNRLSVLEWISRHTPSEE